MKEINSDTHSCTVSFASLAIFAFCSANQAEDAFSEFRSEAKTPYCMHLLQSLVYSLPTYSWTHLAKRLFHDPHYICNRQETVLFLRTRPKTAISARILIMWTKVVPSICQRIDLSLPAPLAEEHLRRRFEQPMREERHQYQPLVKTSKCILSNEIRDPLDKSPSIRKHVTQSFCTVSFILNGIWWFVVVVVFVVPTVLQYSTVQYRHFLKILSDDFAHALTLSRTLQRIDF
jgi:hypothetical protein